MNNVFGKRLTIARKDANLTQDGLASLISISAQAISKWENGLTYPDIDMLCSLADILDVTVEYLLGRSTIFSQGRDSGPIDVTIIMKMISETGGEVTFTLPYTVLKKRLKVTQLLPKVEDTGYGLAIDLASVIELVDSGASGKVIDIKAPSGAGVIISIEKA